MSHPNSNQHHFSSTPNNPMSAQQGAGLFPQDPSYLQRMAQQQPGVPQQPAGVPHQPSSQALQYNTTRQTSAFQPVIQLQGGDGSPAGMSPSQYQQLPRQMHFNQINPPSHNSFPESDTSGSSLLPASLIPPPGTVKHLELLENAHTRAVERSPSVTSGPTPSRPLMKTIQRAERPFDVIAPNSLTYQVCIRFILIAMNWSYFHSCILYGRMKILIAQP